MKTIVVLMALSGLPGGVTAQNGAAYSRVVGDTLRFREVSIGEIAVETPQGAMVTNTTHNAVIALMFRAVDTALAWYEELDIGVRGPMGASAPSTSEALREPFALVFDSRGRIQVLETPVFPESFESITDLTHQFDDFFLILPLADMRIGVAWVDTVVQSSRAGAERQYRFERIVHSAVARDTVIGDVRAFVVEQTQLITLQSAGVAPGTAVLVNVTMSGSDSGIVVFDLETGSLLGRSRVGELAGPMTIGTENGNVSLTQTMRYTNAIRPVNR